MKLSVFLVTLAFLSQVSWGKLRVCYFTNWAQYRPDPMKLWPENVDASLCTHIVYAFSDMYGNDLYPFEWNDHDLFARLQTLKTQYPGQKTLLGVGGWTFQLAKMTSMLSTDANRAEFIQNSINYLREHGFDGMDLDFEYPGGRGSPPGDKYLYTKLIQEARAGFNAEELEADQETLLLTIAVACGKEYIDAGYEIPLISPEVDWIGLMSYDLNGAFDPITGFNAPLRADAPDATEHYKIRSLDWCATYWHEGGAPKEKLLPGLAIHGRGFTLEDANNNGLYAPATGGPPLWASNNGSFTREPGIFSYYEVCDVFLNHGTTVERPAPYDVPFTYRGDQWVGYDDLESVTLKAQYICDNEYAGYIAWCLDLDDFNNNFCDQGNNPLHTKAKEVIQQCGSPSQPPTSSTTSGTTPPTPTSPTTPTTTPPTRTPPTTTTPILPTTPTPPNPTTSSGPTPNPPANCVTNPGFCDDKLDGVYAHDNCRKFIVCLVQCIEMTCDLGHYWNPYTKYCDVLANLPPDIQDKCFPPRKSIIKEESVCEGKAAGKHAIPGTCTAYMECLAGQDRSVVRHCGRGRCYDSSKKRCDWCSQVKCD